MAKTNLSPIRKSAERLKDVRPKGAHSDTGEHDQLQIEAIKASKQRPLRREQIAAIFERKNQVNGRYVASFNVKKAILDMYPNILAPLTSKSPEQVNPSPITPVAAPEVAPPPIIQEAPKTSPAAENVVSLDAYRTKEGNTKEAVKNSQPVLNEVDEERDQADMLAKARADIEEIYDNGDSSRRNEAA